MRWYDSQPPATVAHSLQKNARWQLGSGVGTGRVFNDRGWLDKNFLEGGGGGGGGGREDDWHGWCSSEIP